MQRGHRPKADKGRAAKPARGRAAGAAPAPKPAKKRDPTAKPRDDGESAVARHASPRGPLFSADLEPQPPPQPPELDWDDAPPADALVLRWTAKGEELFKRLAEHGALEHEVRADLKGGRFVWIDPGGRVSAEARAQVLCSWSRATSVVAMAWADPLVRGAGIPRIDGMASECDDIDEEGAWRIAMEAAEATGASYLYRVSAPHAWYFLALRDLSFTPKRCSFHPGAPVGLVLRALGEVRQAIESRAEPSAVVRERIVALGSSLFHQAEYTYRGTDWVARLDRTGKRLMHLAKRLPRASYTAVAAGQRVEEWIGRELALELIEAIGLLEDEWSLFG
ncbi:MAG: hypothetical protein IT372_02595 [Polyangiaceae bacterium]|nr:hypothetical protein [Polyangiaceae bacterium]